MTTASPVLSSLSAHLQIIESEPTTQLNTELIEQCELFTSTAEYRGQTWKETQPLFLQIAALLPQLQQDPSPLVHFITKLATPYRFEDIKDVDFEIALDLQATPFHGLILSLLHKATASSADTQVLANRPDVVAAIVRLWLCTQDTGVATQAEDLLFSLLKASKNEPLSITGEDTGHTHGTGPMWRRLFNDQDVRSLYYHHTYLQKLSSPPLPDLSKREKTIAQARLLSLLPRVGSLHWDTLVVPHATDVEREIGLSEDQGLLHYATMKMVDTEEDMLMYMTLISFFSKLITTVKTTPHLTHYCSSLALDFLQEQGTHKQLIDFHTTDSPGVEHSFLSSRTAKYISDYAHNYPENFEKSPELSKIRDYVHRNIRKCEASDLDIIASMPRSTLIPRRGSSLAWDECIILDMPITRTNQDALKTLATVFRGPPKEELTFPQVETLDSDTKRIENESAYARLLTALFINKKPNTFSDIISHTNTVAMKENALAALAFLRALITASWSSELIPDVPAGDPIYARLSNFPKTGLDLILDSSISGGVLPALLKPATSFSNLVGGRGDAENAAYQVAMAKFDVLKALGRELEQNGGREDVLFMVKRRVKEGPWGVGGSAGSRIGTLEL
ncbi:uncharacterized protein M421DRAFT_416223 [Didymella exigua CBS 183.55]|uniref:Uncharacterized protein n=1 Tax=Didymella exigua CBS 183.55 TaxID=1150837 RepID=A0A6A5S537_9PLEO|nr:uncharacterized protein M421DRAFT_416223 [Didymella exigua CBS 183.55]KAF1932597.1 hypothetical protein M421DRAFT_416223 [Didymella exigua CBS 183.55]